MSRSGQNKNLPEYKDFVRDLNRHMNEVLSSDDKHFVVHSLKQYITHRNINKFASVLNNCLDNPRKRQLLIKIRSIIPRDDITLFDQLTSNNNNINNPITTTNYMSARYSTPLANYRHHSYSKRIHKRNRNNVYSEPANLSREDSKRMRVVRITSQESGSLGFNIRGGKDYGLGIYVSHVEVGEVADNCGLKIGDLILEANGIDFSNLPHSTAVKVLKSYGSMTMLVRRVGIIPQEKSGQEQFVWLDSVSGKPIKGKSQIQNDEEFMNDAKSDMQLLTRTDERKVLLKIAPNQNIGLSIRGGREYGLGIYVSKVTENSPAYDTGIRVGDHILRVNNVSFRNVSHQRAVQVLKGYSHLMMTIRNIGRFPHSFTRSKHDPYATVPRTRSKSNKPAIDAPERHTVSHDTVSSRSMHKDSRAKSNDSKFIKSENEIANRTNWEIKRSKSSEHSFSKNSYMPKNKNKGVNSTSSPVISRTAGGLGLTNQSLSQSNQILLERTRKAGGDDLANEVQDIVNQYEETKSLDTFARFFRDMDEIKEKGSIIQDARCVLEPRHVILFDRIIHSRPEKGPVTISQKRSSTTPDMISSRPFHKDKSSTVKKLPKSLLSIFESQQVENMIDKASRNRQMSTGYANSNRNTPYGGFNTTDNEHVRHRESYVEEVREAKEENRSFPPPGEKTKVLVEIYKSSPFLGLSIIGGTDTPYNEVLIEDVKAGGAAYIDGFLQSHYEIISVEGEAVSGKTHREVSDMINRAFSDVKDTLQMVVIPE